jgi:flagellar motor switch protein FliM
MEPVTFRLDRLETNPRLADIAAPTDAMLVMCGRVDFDGCGGRWHLAFSHEVLDPMRDALGPSILKAKDRERAGRNQAA